MKSTYFLVCVTLFATILAIGCNKGEPVSTAPAEKPSGPKFEAPKSTGGQLALPQNVAIEEGVVNDVEK